MRLFSVFLCLGAAMGCVLKAADGSEYDMSQLPSQLSHELDTPPSKTTYDISVNACGPLDDTSNDDREKCPEGTYACLRIYNELDGNRHIVSTIVLAKGTPDISNATVHFSGGSYAGVAQTLDIDVVKGATNTLAFGSYDALGGVLRLTWTNPASDAEPPASPPDKTPETPETPETPPPPATGSGFFSFLFNLTLFGVLAYLVLGALYNYTQNAATGWDLIPNRDLWRDIPFVVRDLFRSSARDSNYSSI